ncbi:MAG: transketolase [Chloroflexi bacterium]|nr:transketolase [Chloroflexota bacterium]
MVVEKTKKNQIRITKKEVLKDYKLAYKSRQASLIGRREVLSGKAKFGIFGDGKEIAQIAMAKAFQKGDFRSGYYRDQTFMFALGIHSIQEFFAQLFAHTDLESEPASGGRMMNAHFATRSLNLDGSWKNLSKMFNSSADISPTASQMPRMVGLSYASKIYRGVEALKDMTQFSNKGNEVTFGTIGNASCAEGMFWETVNAVGVLKAPMVLSIWDDGYGISVPNEYQITKDLSALLSGFQREPGTDKGYDLYTVKAWDYLTLIETYLKAAKTARQDHIPAIIHVIEVTQPQGHSTSGSHERYKSEKRLEWELEFDCMKIFREWIIDQGLASDGELHDIEELERKSVEDIRKVAWEEYKTPIRSEITEFGEILDEIATVIPNGNGLIGIKKKLANLHNPVRQDIMVAVRDALFSLRGVDNPTKQVLIQWKQKMNNLSEERISSNLYSTSLEAASRVPEVKSVYSDNSEIVNGFEVLKRGFDAMLGRDARVIAFGEDLGYLGGVNQGFSGLQEKYGELRVTDTGIRETTIIGQAIGMAMRGLKPIAELQYLDYVLYGLQIMSDDLATLSWRTKGGQKAPVIIRTRGHRLEGVWHSGSPMAGLIHLVRGMHVLVPRNMVQAVGFYNTLLLSDEPGIVVEVLNGYRLKEKLPDNIGDFTLPLGVPEVIREGKDLTVVTYGPLCRIAGEAADLLDELDIHIEIIDVQSLLPFDIHGQIIESLKKTNRIIFLDEDVPGGASAYMLQEVIEKQGGYYWLDSEPRTLSAKEHRPAYGTDGNYWSKPNVEQILETVYEIIREVEPGSYPRIFN